MLSSSSYDAAPSVNDEEIKFFNNLSSEWWDDKNGGLKVLHSMNKKVVELVEKCAIDAGLAKSEFTNTATPLKDVLILDVGCGGGILSEPLARTSATVIGLDLAPDLIQVAKEHASLDSSLTNLTYVLQSVEEHGLKNAEKYDVVVASGVLEHVDNPELFLQACLRCLKPGGVIVLTTFDKTFIAWLLGIIAMEYVLRFIPIGTHDWNKFVPIEDVKSILKNSLRVASFFTTFNKTFIARLVGIIGVECVVRKVPRGTNDWNKFVAANDGKIFTYNTMSSQSDLDYFCGGVTNVHCALANPKRNGHE